MAKNGSTPAPKTGKPKTAAQIAKAKANAELASRLLAERQERQKLVNGLRKQGITGNTDEEVIANAARIAEQAVIDAEYREADNYVNAVLSVGTFGSIVRRWLAQRVTHNSLKVKGLIVEFLGREQNAKIKAGIDAALTPPLKQAA